MRTYSLLEYVLFPPAYVNRGKLRKQLEGKTILITGASSGIGERLAHQLAELHVHMILVARSEELKIVDDGVKDDEGKMKKEAGKEPLSLIVSPYPNEAIFCANSFVIAC